ncbi:MAG: shikimate kinase AroL [Deltaproteobacteria bacterium]|jgi:shikimate kinase|nr:shikimate kinase AroL [Deltaproteobacteria bacterium]
MLLQKHPFLTFLIGARASGKSTLGHLLAAKLTFVFVDTDQQIRAISGLEVDEIVARNGWPAFRAQESAVLRECARPRTVVATGGGMVLDPRNCEFMRATGTVVFLDVPAQFLSSRLAADPRALQRPSLTGRSPAEEIAQVLAEREPMYRAAAHHIVNAVRPLPELVREIADIILQPWGSGSM